MDNESTKIKSRFTGGWLRSRKGRMTIAGCAVQHGHTAASLGQHAAARAHYVEAVRQLLIVLVAS